MAKKTRANQLHAEKCAHVPKGMMHAVSSTTHRRVGAGNR